MPASTFLYDRPYTQLRGAALLFLSDVGHVLRQTLTEDEGGGATAAWAEVGEEVPCRVDAFGGSESLAAGRISELTSHAIVVPVSTDITVQDRLAIDGRGTFLITAVPEITAQMLRTLEAAQLSQ